MTQAHMHDTNFQPVSFGQQVTASLSVGVIYLVGSLALVWPLVFGYGG